MRGSTVITNVVDTASEFKKFPTTEAVSVVMTSADSERQHFHLVHSFADPLSFLRDIIHQQNGLLDLPFAPSVTISATGASASTELALCTIRGEDCDAL